MKVKVRVLANFCKNDKPHLAKIIVSSISFGNEECEDTINPFHH